MSMPAIDLTAQRFGHLVVLKRMNTPAPLKWLCRCDCDRETVKVGSRLRRGNVKSCGCATKSLISKARKTHGMTGSRLEYIRRGMVARCHNAKRKDYPRYGGRGIKVCESWLNDPAQFYSWAQKNGYDDTLSIDRIDSNKNYCPQNCRWIPLADNIADANRRRRKQR